MIKKTKTKALKNKDILKNNFQPISSNPLNTGDWETFLELSKTAKMIWFPKAGRDFDNIDLKSNPFKRLYVFTDTIPAEGVYDFIINADKIQFYSGDKLNIIISNICELKFYEKVELCFWKRVNDSISNGENVDPLENEYKNMNPTIQHLGPKSFKEIVKSLINDNSANLIGRSFLMSLMLGDSNTSRLTRQYILYMFVDTKYFEQTFRNGLGLQCEHPE